MFHGAALLVPLGVAVAIAVGAAIHYRHRALLQANEIEVLQEAIMHDPLTGLLNRRGFQERMEIEVERALRDDTPLMLVVADLDDFKQVNDRLGHLGGDMALERVSGVIARTTRRADAAARLGGEEFAFILPNTSELEAYAFAERLRIDTEDGFSGTAIELTFSLGIAGFPQHGTTPETLLNAADQAMYLAKSLGKNRTALNQAASPELVAMSPAVPE